MVDFRSIQLKGKIWMIEYILAYKIENIIFSPKMRLLDTVQALCISNGVNKIKS